jgi:mRNA interferase MazF
MMTQPQRREVWLVDLELAARARPCLVVSIPARDINRALVTVIPYTTGRDHKTPDISIPFSWLPPGVFDVSKPMIIPENRLSRPLGALSCSQFEIVTESMIPPASESAPVSKIHFTPGNPIPVTFKSV